MTFDSSLEPASEPPSPLPVAEPQAAWPRDRGPGASNSIPRALRICDYKRRSAPKGPALAPSGVHRGQPPRPGNPRPAAIGTPIPGPGQIGKRGFPVSRFPPNRESGIPRFRFWPNRESGIPSPIPGQIGNRRNGNWGFGPLAHGTCHGPLAAAADVRWGPEISIFEDQRQHLAPGSCLVLTWDGYPPGRFPDFRPNREIGDSLIPDFGRIGKRGFPPRFPAGIPDSRPNRESGERELGISGS